MTKKTPSDIDEYIAGFPASTQIILNMVRKVIAQEAPDAIESIKYAIPTFELNGNLVHFAAFKNHIGFYAMPSGNEEFKHELSAYKSGKGSVQFPLNEPMPLSLIKKMVRFRVKQNRALTRARSK